MKNEYYAHVNDINEKQTVKDHCINVGGIASIFASKFGAENTAKVCGLLHDVGKCSIQFQNRLLNNGIKVDHATAGGKELEKLFGKSFQRLLGYPIIGHHSGLSDFGSEERGLIQRFNKEIPKYDAEEILNLINTKDVDLKKEIPKNYENSLGFVFAFYIRMIYSALVDADYLDTEDFCNVSLEIQRGNYKNFNELETIFEKYMEKVNKNARITPINIIRQKIFYQCIEKAECKPNLFSLTVPTGGGKTLSSLAFALKHLQYNKLDRIIFVIPYTSIIEQNAAIYKSIFGEGNVLEHHSNFDFSSNNENDKTLDKLKLACENWDIPIVVTTNVQFFESLFASRSSRCRKLHNVTNSVVIIDEAQMLPTKFLKPTLMAINELVNNYNSTVLLSTATKPKFPKEVSKKECIEIINDPDGLYEKLRRVSVKYIGELSDENLITNIEEIDKVLIIVNTRKHAQKLFEALSSKEYLFHLSANMCPEHRSRILKKIRKILKNGEKCIVISTQLIECGVDISFPVVYRSLSGIDSIVQSAGRCNREGELEDGRVFVFTSTEEYALVRGYQSIVANCGREILEKYSDPLSLEAISNYFEILYDLERENLDSKKILKNFEEKANVFGFNFEKTSTDYKLIEESETLIIPYDEVAENLINELKFSEYPNSCIRKLQKYSISIHSSRLEQLKSKGGLTVINSRFNVLSTKDGFYDETTGLVLDKQEILIC